MTQVGVAPLPTWGADWLMRSAAGRVPRQGSRRALLTVALVTTLLAVTGGIALAGIGAGPAFASHTRSGDATSLARGVGDEPESAARAAAAAAAMTYVPHVVANGNIPQPGWWHGSCDSNGPAGGSHRLGAAWDGLVSCGPQGDTVPVDFYTDSWGEYEWQCVELSMRWMYLAWGVPPYAANGNTVVDNYATYNTNGPALTVVRNGTPGRAPQAGDVLELSYGADGHTEVVASSSVNSSGNGTVRVITENVNYPPNGWDTLTVTDWTVSSPFGTVVDWLHNPAWSLQEPLEYKVANGTLSLQTDQVRGPYVPVATNIQDAQVVGGGGGEPAPFLVVLTTSGQLEIGYDLPSTPLLTLASGVTQFAASSGAGSPGWPTIGWLTSAGDFYTVTGNFHTDAPVLQATGVSSIAVGSNSPSVKGTSTDTTGPLLGYVTPSTEAYVKAGTGSFQRVAIGVKRLVLADDGASGTNAVEGYIGTAGGAHVRVGLASRFQRIVPAAVNGITPTVTDLSLSTVGTNATPFVAYATSSQEVFAELGGSDYQLVSSAATRVIVAAADTAHGIPLLAIQRTSGDWFLRDGGLTGQALEEGTATDFGLSTLVVS